MNKFQFLMVQLKDNVKGNYVAKHLVSIPNGAIKRQLKMD